MKKLSKRLVLAAGALALGALVTVGVLSQTAVAADPATPATYVGQATCAKCHADKVKDYSMTGHATAFRPISDYTLTNASSPITLFDSSAKDKPVSTQLKFDATNTLGVMMDHYVVAKLPASAGFTSAYYRVGALEKNSDGTYTLEPATSGDFDKDGKSGDFGVSSYTCGNCHSSGVDDKIKDAANMPKDAGISCESCHGPGSNHVAATDKKGSYGNIGPESCYKCHPVDNAVNANGTNGLPTKDTTGTWTATNHYGVRGFYATKHYTSAKLNSCLTCHDPHEQPSKAGHLLAVTDKHNDTAANLCNQCHAGHFTDDAVASAFWDNPVDARSHITADHSMYQIKKSDYVIQTTDAAQQTGNMKLGPKLVNQIRTLYPSYFAK